MEVETDSLGLICHMINMDAVGTGQVMAVVKGKVEAVDDSAAKPTKMAFTT